MLAVHCQTYISTSLHMKSHTAETCSYRVCVGLSPWGFGHHCHRGSIPDPDNYPGNFRRRQKQCKLKGHPHTISLPRTTITSSIKTTIYVWSFGASPKWGTLLSTTRQSQRCDQLPSYPFQISVSLATAAAHVPKSRQHLARYSRMLI